MSEEGEKPAPKKKVAPKDPREGLDLALAVALGARRQTFLAYYPRKLKLAVTAILFLSLVIFLSMAISRLTTHSSSKRSDGQPLENYDVSDEDLHQSTAQKPTLPKGAFTEFKTKAEEAAAAENDKTEDLPPLSIAPDQQLIEETPYGRLPKIDSEGRTPWQVYARPFNFQDPRPRIALVISELGFSRIATDAALRRLPPQVTMAFDVQAASVTEWMTRARQDGHETLLSIPMEPLDYPRSDPGPGTLLTSITNSDNVQRFLDALGKSYGYIGITTLSGSRFTSDITKIKPIMDVLHERGLTILDSQISKHSVLKPVAKEMNVPVAVSTRLLDMIPTPGSIDKALNDLEQEARLHGTAIGLATPLPVTIERLELWAKSLTERGIVLAPLSTVVE